MQGGWLSADALKCFFRAKADIHSPYAGWSEGSACAADGDQWNVCQNLIIVRFNSYLMLKNCWIIGELFFDWMESFL